jgi:prophage antirepressor-like protein
MEESKMLRKYERTNIFIIDKELWAWAQYRAKTLGYQSTSEYIFDLIKLDKEETLLKQKKG